MIEGLDNKTLWIALATAFVITIALARYRRFDSKPLLVKIVTGLAAVVLIGWTPVDPLVLPLAGVAAVVTLLGLLIGIILWKGVGIVIKDLSGASKFISDWFRH